MNRHSHRYCRKVPAMAAIPRALRYVTDSSSDAPGVSPLSGVGPGMGEEWFPTQAGNVLRSEAANAVIDLAEERFTKNLWSERASAQRPQLVSVRDETDQARYVVEKVSENREPGLALKTQAVLFRASHHSVPLAEALIRHITPCGKFAGLTFVRAR